MKNLLIIALFLFSIGATGQAIHNQGVQIKGLAPATATDTMYLTSGDNGIVKHIDKKELKNRLFNEPFSISSAYTTHIDDNHNKGIVTAGSINLDATGLPVGYELRILNTSVLSIPITLEAGQSITLGQAVKSLESGYYAYVEVVDTDTWSVIIPPISAAAPPGSIGGTVGGQYEIAYGSAVTGEIITSPLFTFDGLDLNLGGNFTGKKSMFVSTDTYGASDGFRIFGTSDAPRSDFISTNVDVHGVSPAVSNGVHTEITSHQGDVVIGAVEPGREVKVANDPLTTWGVGNLGFNDNRYLQEADFSNYGRLDSSQNQWLWGQQFDRGFTVSTPPLNYTFADAKFWNASPSAKTSIMVGGNYPSLPMSAIRLINQSIIDGSGTSIGFGFNLYRNSSLVSIYGKVYGATEDANVVTAQSSTFGVKVADNSQSANTEVLLADKNGVWVNRFILDRDYQSAGLNSDFYMQAVGSDGGSYLMSGGITPIVFSNLLTPLKIQTFHESASAFMPVATTNWAYEYLVDKASTQTITGEKTFDQVNIATLNLSGIPTYADEAAAITGGLSSGDVYKTATGELRIKL